MERDVTNKDEHIISLYQKVNPEYSLEGLILLAT